MKKLLVLSFSVFFLYSCGSSKNYSKDSNKAIIGNNYDDGLPEYRISSHDYSEEEFDFGFLMDEPTYSLSSSIIDYAKSFEGTRYKYGGTTAAGMDCSGLICIAFEKENISLPRVSRDMATKGTPISLKKVEKGDLVFFKTDSRRNRISHVGLVVETDSGNIRFIHSTTRAGVIISSLEEAYWKKAFVEVRRVI